MQPSMKKARIDVDGQCGKSGNSQTVFCHGQRDREQTHNHSLPRSLQEHVAREDRHDQQREGGSNSTAFFGHSNRDTRQGEHQSLLEVRDAEQAKKDGGGLRASHLKRVNYFGQERLGNGHHKEQE